MNVSAKHWSELQEWKRFSLPVSTKYAMSTVFEIEISLKRIVMHFHLATNNAYRKATVSRTQAYKNAHEPENAIYAHWLTSLSIKHTQTNSCISSTSISPWGTGVKINTFESNWLKSTFLTGGVLRTDPIHGEQSMDAPIGLDIYTHSLYRKELCSVHHWQPIKKHHKYATACLFVIIIIILAL